MVSKDNKELSLLIFQDKARILPDEVMGGEVGRCLCYKVCAIQVTYPWRVKYVVDVDMEDKAEASHHCDE